MSVYLQQQLCPDKHPRIYKKILYTLVRFKRKKIDTMLFYGATMGFNFSHKLRSLSLGVIKNVNGVLRVKPLMPLSHCMLCNFACFYCLPVCVTEN